MPVVDYKSPSDNSPLSKEISPPPKERRPIQVGLAVVGLAALLAGIAIGCSSNSFLLAMILICFGASGFGIAVGIVTPPGETAERQLLAVVNSAMICPHCQIKGSVTTKGVKLKKGVSGGKATAAVLTGGVSLLATGLSRTEELTKAHCTHCGNSWHF